jgi:hypothetical protein
MDLIYEDLSLSLICFLFALLLDYDFISGVGNQAAYFFLYKDIELGSRLEAGYSCLMK